MIALPITSIDLLGVAATIQPELVARGESVTVAQVAQALEEWIVSTAEDLVQEARYHVLSGDASFAVGRDEFFSYLSKAQRAAAPAAAVEAVPAPVSAA